MRPSIDRITDKYLSTKKENNILGVQVASCEAIDNNAIKMLIASSTPIKPNTASAFVYASTDHTLSPYPPSFVELLNSNDGNYYASIIAYRMPFKMKVDDPSNKLVQIGASSYLDESVDEIWEKTEVEGKSVFFRKNDTSIDNIVDDMMLASSIPTKVSIPKLTFEKGTIVEAFALDKKGEPKKIIGKVLDYIEDQIVIKSDKLYNVKANAVYKNIIKGSTPNEVMEYLKKAYSNGNSEEYEKLIEQMFTGV